MITIYDKNNSKLFPLYDGMNYTIGNKVKCIVDIQKVKHADTRLVYDTLLNIFSDDSKNSMYRFITLSTEQFKKPINLKDCAMYLCPIGYVKGEKGYINENLEYFGNILHKRRIIKGFVINTNYNNAQQILPDYRRYDRRLKNIKGESLLIKSTQLKSLENKINKNNRPASICVVADNTTDIDCESIIKIMTWSTDCYYRRSETGAIINIYKILDAKKVNVEDMLTISRVSIVPNNVEKYLLDSLGLVMDNATHVLHMLSCIKLSKNEIVVDECNICIDDKSRLETKCGHRMCVLCFVNILDKGRFIKCPYCRTKVEPNECTLLSNIIHSRLYTINWITGFFNKSVIYVDDENDKNVIRNISKRNVVDAAFVHNTDIDRLNNISELILLATHKDIKIVQQIKGIDNIICRSNNNKVITDKKAYGNDFINGINKLTLSLYSYTC